MSRVIHTQSPGKIRHHHRRTIAEAMRRLSKKQQIDQGAKDLAALIVFSLHGIADTIEQTISAWEKRDYWMKAERFRQKWLWLEPRTEELSEVIYRGQWNALPDVLARLMPHFTDITVKRMTRSPDVWEGAYDKFMED